MVTTSQRAIDEWVGFAVTLADASRAILATMVGVTPSAEVKPDGSLVSALDRRIEDRLREMVFARYPGHGFFGEETDPARLDSELVWVIDPIDGTAPFIAGIPVYGTLIALAQEGVPLLGIIDQPATGDRWIGARGRATTHGDRPTSTRGCADLKQAMLAINSPDYFSAEEKQRLAGLRGGVRHAVYGGACLSYGLLASGRLDLAISSGLKPYDFAPFGPVIEGAGGIITDWQGAPLTLASGPRVLAAGDRARHSEALAALASD